MGTGVYYKREETGNTSKGKVKMVLLLLIRDTRSNNFHISILLIRLDDGARIFQKFGGLWNLMFEFV
jgi:hypothetical protein